MNNHKPQRPPEYERLLRRWRELDDKAVRGEALTDAETREASRLAVAMEPYELALDMALAGSTL